MMSEELQKAEACDPRPGTIRHALQEGAEFLSRIGVETAYLDAELLLGKALKTRREKLYLNYDIPLEAHHRLLYDSLLQRRALREPISYVTGEREFWSLDFLVTPEVLVPRPETEVLVEVALQYLEKFRNSNFEIRILDIGTGSGAIAVSLAKELSDVEICATDLSLGALEIARANAMRHSVREKIHLLQGDLFEPVQAKRGLFHMIVANPPYVRRADIKNLPPEVRDWEPRLALDGGAEGLDFYRRIIHDGHLFVTYGGFLALEIGADMAEEVSRLFANAGCYCEASVHRDFAGRDRVLVARKLSKLLAFT